VRITDFESHRAPYHTKLYSFFISIIPIITGLKYFANSISVLKDIYLAGSSQAKQTHFLMVVARWGFKPKLKNII
jgi:hypothetical protein